MGKKRIKIDNPPQGSCSGLAFLAKTSALSSSILSTNYSKNSPQFSPIVKSSEEKERNSVLKFEFSVSQEQKEEEFSSKIIDHNPEQKKEEELSSKIIDHNQEQKKKRRHTNYCVLDESENYYPDDENNSDETPTNYNIIFDSSFDSHSNDDNEENIDVFNVLLDRNNPITKIINFIYDTDNFLLLAQTSLNKIGANHSALDETIKKSKSSSITTHFLER